MQTIRDYLTLTSANFEKEVFECDGPVLVDFWADWSGPCFKVAHVLDDLVAEYSGRVKMGKLDVDSHPDLGRRFRIRSLPTVIFFKAGELIYRVVGVASKPEFALRLDSLLTPRLLINSL
jgi:thioredoxin 1